MATARQSDQRPEDRLLRNGDRLMQSEFHSAYLNMPENYRAELIGGIVFEPSPVSWPHGTNDIELHFLLKTYAKATKGIEVASNATVILGDEDEVQPDATLRIAPNRGGQSRNRGKYVEGPPELVAEIAYSSRAIDLHLKKERYALAGILEYIVVCLEPEQAFHWFDLRGNKKLVPDEEGIIRSNVFPGLWLNVDHFFQATADETLKNGLQSAEHHQFCERLRP